MNSAKLAAKDKKNVWHPFTQMTEWATDPMVIIESGKGNYLVDTEGRRYLDGVSSLWCNVHGHQVPAIDKAVAGQLKKIAHSTFLGLSHVPAVELSSKLLAVAPKGLTHVFYSDSGSASVEVALKMAYQYWQNKGFKRKKTFLNLKNAYHGDTIGAVSVGGIGIFHQIFGPLLFKTYQADAPYYYRDSFRGDDYALFCASKVEKQLKHHHKEIVAIIVEPLMQGAAGMLDQPRGYLAKVAALAKKYGILLIVDEVATGFGRTGKMFACERENVRPDLLCVAKGLTAGYLPLSATLANDRVYKAFLGKYGEFKAFFHGHTYAANPLACAAAIANLDLFKREKTLENLEMKIHDLRNGLQVLYALEHVGDVRQVGLMAGVELVKNKKTKQPFPLDERIGHRICMAARKRGVMLRPLGNVIVVMPPLSITPAEIKTLCRVISESIEEVTG